MATQKIKCPNCGKFVKEGISYCLFCGMQISDIVNDDPIDDEETFPEQSVNSLESPKSVISNQATPQPKESNNTTIPNQIIEEDNDEDVDNTDVELEEEMDEEIEPNQGDQDELDEEMELDEPTSSKSSEDENEEDIEDDDESFMETLNHKPKKEPSSKKKSLSPNKILDSTTNVFSRLMENKPKELYPKKSEKEKPKETPPKKSDYNPNYDGYYDNLIAIVDARTEHIQKDNVIKTIGIVTVAIIFIVFMMYCV